MTWGNRLRLLAGSLLIVVVVAGLTLLFKQRQHQATSSSASIAAVEFPVGSDYAGTVTRTFVDRGQTVAKGAPLLTEDGALAPRPAPPRRGTIRCVLPRGGAVLELRGPPP